MSKFYTRKVYLALLSFFLISTLGWYFSIYKGVKLNANTSANVSQSSASETKAPDEYLPAKVERFFMDNLLKLGYDNTTNNPITCDIWTDPEVTSPEIHADLLAYGQDLDNYTVAIQNFEKIPDLLKAIQESDGSHSICKKARPHPDGVKALFPSNQLSYSSSGFIDPLLPPMRNRKFCQDKKYLMNLDYLVHDFETMCRNLKPTSKRILVDMGASLNFHGNTHQPMLSLMELYEKFGFNFDHIYAYEVKYTDATSVYGELLPEKYLSSYHWINVGVSAEEGHKMNPLHSILKKFDEDDFIVVKLDIDTNSIEVPLAKQLLEDKDGVYAKLVDQFYFEHHVHLGELAGNWASTMVGSVKDSFELFYGLREKGIPSHFWP